MFFALKKSDPSSVIKFKEVLVTLSNEKINYSILVVDDDNRIRELIKEYLSENNYIVSTAENALEANEKLSHF